ncbi:MAG: 16S rRNA (adenine(1518)-N(6)/adenine(1519)-N(6))-dimethyltransferase RsmA, partial [Desulforhopalus sp.]
MSRQKQTTHETLKANKLAPKKRFGQNFLVHNQTAQAIIGAAGVEGGDTIVEVGVGLGALTIPLAAKVKHVFGYEIDSGIIRMHQTEKDLPENVTLVHQDILKADFQEIAGKSGGPVKILANLPYSISNPFIFKLIDNAALVDSAIIMLQKEVAERLMAEPGTKDYGVPTVLLGSCSLISRIMTLKPNEFHPKPKIDSVVISLDFNGRRLLPLSELHYDYTILRRIVRTTFNQRRKTIQNTLSGAGLFCSPTGGDKPLCKQIIRSAIEQAGLQPTARPETLSITDFIGLAVEI